MKPGSKQTADTKRRQSLAKTDPDVLLMEDAKTLRLMGPVDRFTFAERVGCSERIAYTRLTRLVEAGYATKWKPRGAIAYTYAATDASGLATAGR